MDPKGNVYTAGFFVDNSLNVYHGSPGPQSSSLLAATLMPDDDLSFNNVYMLRYKNNGTYDWGITVGPHAYVSGGSSGYNVISTVVSKFNHVYLTAAFDGAKVNLYNDQNHPVCAINQYDSSMNINVLLAKYDSTGDFHWVARVDGPNDELIRNAVAVDASDNTYLSMMYKNVQTGSPLYVYRGLASPGSKGHVNADSSCNLFYTGTSGFVVKFSPSGIPQWTLQLGSQLYWGSIKMQTGQDGSLYITGNLNVNTNDILFYDAVSSGTQNTVAIRINQVNNIGPYNMFVVKYSPAGLCQWANIVSGVNDGDSNGGPYIGSYSIAVDSHGNSFTTGYFGDKLVVYERYLRNVGNTVNSHTTPYATLMSHRAPDLGTWNGVYKNGYVLSFDNLGQFRWVVQMYNNNVRGFDVAVDINNQVVVSGYFGYWRQSLYITDPISYQADPEKQNQEPVNFNSYTMRHVGENDSESYKYFIVKLTNNGKVIWGVQMGNTYLDATPYGSNFLTNSIATNNVSTKRDI